MELIEALESKKKAILDVWIERTLDSYTSSGFFKKSQDQFANPVGSNIAQGLSAIFDLLLAKAEINTFQAPLDQVIRIRAVQDFTPGQAIAPILELKWVIRQVLSTGKETQTVLSDLDVFDCEVDRLALAAFDLYVECREQLYQNRVRELQSGRHILTDSACPSALVREQQTGTQQSES